MKFRLPKTVNDDCDYREALNKELDDYLNHIKIEFIPNQSVINSTEENIELIKLCINHYYSGQVSEAKKSINKIVNKYIKNKFIVSELNKSYSTRGLSNFSELNRTGTEEQYEKMKNLDLHFFKARVSDDSNTRYEKRDMLHIPYTKRDIISTQRFSIPGVPCFYFAASSYVCWNELNNPAMDKFNIASYKLPDDVKIFNLSIDYYLIHGLLGGMPNEDEKKIGMSTIEIWPLVCATSYRVKNSKGKFRSEYIISQLLMECMIEHEIDGIAYYTKRIDLNLQDSFRYVNLAILANDKSGSASKEFSPLCSEIKFTSPVNVKEFELLTEPYNLKGEENNSFLFFKIEDKVINLASTKILYKNSLFGLLDNFLILSEHETVKI